MWLTGNRSSPPQFPASASGAGQPSPSVQLEQPVFLPCCRMFLKFFRDALKRFGFLCLQPIDLLHGAGVDVLCPQHKQRAQALCFWRSWAALAAPPCGAFSLARLKPGGPRPVRNPQFPDGLPGLRPDQLRELTVSRKLHVFACELLSLVSMRGGIILFENPTSRLTWKTQGAEAWMRQFTPYLANVAACSHGTCAS